jgi:HK97 family phage prohead protease
MPETKHISTKARVTDSADGQGIIEAAFSVFDTIDSAGDVVLKSAFQEGQEVPMVWSHNWDMPIGKGTVHVTPKQAVFKGNLWLDTEDGLQAFRKMRNAGTLQEFSWGFQILDAEPGVKDGQDVRFIKGAELFEVSPVLVGANRATRLLSLKAAEAAGVVAVAVEVEDPPEPEPEPEPDPDPEQEESEDQQDKIDFALGDVDRLVEHVQGADLADDDDRKAIQAAISKLEHAQRELAAALKRTDPIAQVEPRNQYRRFQQLTARHGLSSAP